MIKVNHITITEKQVLKEMQYFPAQSQRQAMLEAAQSLIIGELLRQRAQVLSIAIEANNKESYLEQLIEHEVPSSKATIEECLHYFQQNPQRFTTSPLVEVSHILLPADPENVTAREEAKALAEDIIYQLQNHADFSALAQQFSACPSKEIAGSLGQISQGQTVAEFEHAVFHAANIGLQPEPIESRYGFHIVDIKNHIEGQPLEFNMVEDKIRLYLDEKIRHKAIAQYIQTLIDAANIEGFDFTHNGKVSI